MNQATGVGVGADEQDGTERGHGEFREFAGEHWKGSCLFHIGYLHSEICCANFLYSLILFQI